MAYLRSRGKLCLVVSQTGIAATLHDGGRTVCSRFALPLDLKDNSVSRITPNSSEGYLMRNCDLIMWDEATTAHKYAYETVDRLFRDVTQKRNSYFGSKIFVLSGDFRQTLPVVRRGTSLDVINSCVKRSYIWQAFSVSLRFSRF